MTEPTPTDRPRRRWGRYFAATFGLLFALTLVRLVYPTIRQHQIITQLKERGFTFQRQVFRNHQSASWTTQKWIPQKWRDAYGQQIRVAHETGVFTPDDFASLNELVSLDEEGFHSPPRCWLSFVMRNIKDRDLAPCRWQQRLEHLYLSSKEFSDDGMYHLRGAVHLSSLSLDAPKVGDRGLAHLSRMNALKRLHLNGQSITDAGLVHLKGMTQLQTLQLTSTRISGAGLMHLTGLWRLERLDLSNSPITDQGIVHITKLRNLRWLSLSGSRITNAGIGDGVNLPPHLFFLGMERTQVTESQIKSLRRSRWPLRVSSLFSE